MTVHQNSIDAYHAEEPRLSRRADAVLAWITEHGPHTDREVMEGMGFREPNAVRPRITELIEAGRLMEVGDVRCPVTGKRVRRVDIRRPRQAVFCFASVDGEPIAAPSTLDAQRALSHQTRPISVSAGDYAKGTTP